MIVSEIFKAYSIKETSKITGIPEGTLRQWEKDLEGVLHIPRDENNYRYYTELEIETLERIKFLRDKDLSIKTIKEMLSERPGKEIQPVIQPSVPQMKQNEVIETLRSIQTTLETLPAIKEMIVSQIREDIKSELRDEIKNEIISTLETSNKEAFEELKGIYESTNNMVQQQQKQLLESAKNEIASNLESSNKKAFEEFKYAYESDNNKIQQQQKQLLENTKNEIASSLELANRELSEKVKDLSESHKAEVNKRDELLLKNMELMEELKKEKNKSFFQKLFTKKR